jgi:hypothetical protein
MTFVKSGFFWGAPSHKPIAWAGGAERSGGGSASGLPVDSWTWSAAVSRCAPGCRSGEPGLGCRAPATTHGASGRMDARGPLGLCAHRQCAGDPEPALGRLVRPAHWRRHCGWRPCTGVRVRLWRSSQPPLAIRISDETAQPPFSLAFTPCRYFCAHSPLEKYTMRFCRRLFGYLLAA